MKAIVLAVLFLCWVSAIAHAAPKPAVVLEEDESTFTLDNGIVRARAAKHSGDLLSLTYQGMEMLEAGAGHQAGYWSHNTARGQHFSSVTIDPKTNGGSRGEVSIKGISNGTPLGSGPGGSAVADIEIRYVLGRGDSGLYTYSIFTHQTNYPGTSVGEARFCAKLNDRIFDWMTVDARRNMKMITAYDWDHGTVMNMKEARRMNSGIYQGQVEHKYDYSANQFEVRAWGWSSSEKRVGLWFINPSVEYLSCGPTKVELSAHRDATFGNNPDAPAPPTLLNYWRSSHYGGSICSIASTDAWTKVIGPFLIYCNSGGAHDTLWKSALAKAVQEANAWPYDWVSGTDYPNKEGRGTLKGRLVLNDPLTAKTKLTHLLVGLSVPDYAPPRISRGGFGGFTLSGGGEDDTNVLANTGFTNRNNMDMGLGAGTNSTSAAASQRPGGRGRGGFGGFGAFAFPRIVDWQNDAKHYEFWVHGEADGTFTIPNIRPGTYTLHAIADGVLGEFMLTNVTVLAGQKLDLRKLPWQPVRYGKQIWEIGIPNRSGGEFLKGDDYYHWGWYLEYPKLFPNDINFVIGKSDFHKDWFFEQVPHNEDPVNTSGTGFGRSNTWSIVFNLPKPQHGKAILRLAICGNGTRSIAAAVNDQSIGSVTGLVYNATINRDGIGGSWTERDLTFDAALMKAGENIISLTIPSGSLTSGVIYDYLRLEVDEAAAPRQKTGSGS